ncbi:AraC family transcriptional regulator [Acidisoma silvae]|uniref:AraC family transcriptional regulator n=1 Tax=Acidisoma silvae TaxID=2802396 RepID=A0A963YQ94_9PROT|nr:AraC family transcriptional regulator [Acidisoma silvae]MCB8874340.1 AraC family transcriptional regulator [Acidisoma silvae]
MLDDLAEAMLRYTDRHPGQSVIAHAGGQIGILRSDHPKPPMHMISRPAICIVAQGAKWATFGDNRLVYRAGEALVVGVEAPSVGRVTEASPDKPCLVLAFELDTAIMRSVAEAMEAPPQSAGESGRGVFVTNFLGPLADCALRLVRLLDKPDAMLTLYPLIMREICYWLLTGPHAGEVMRICLAQGPSQRVIKAMHSLAKRFAEPVRMEELAAVAQLSPSAFHRQFKALTSMTPLQYQKQLRLLEARRLMIAQAVNVEAAAFQVGYESPSQFSREYARMFGAPPKRDARQMQVAFQAA